MVVIERPTMRINLVDEDEVESRQEKSRIFGIYN